MKKIYLASLSIFSISAGFAQIKEVKNTIKFEAISIFNHKYDLQYEKVINDKSSLQLGIGFGNYSGTDMSEVDELHLDNFGSTFSGKNVFIKEKSFSINLDYRYYYMKTAVAPKGLYLSPSLQYLKSNNSYGGSRYSVEGSLNGTSSYKDVQYNQDTSLINVRALVGCQFLIANVVAVNPYFGPSFAFGSAKDYNGKKDSSALGLLLNFGINIGVAF
ncbi:hypothetical protein [Flavobacterium sp. SM2513]|uniref:hypothetical protein n=1 Tax=Flavobacterium sp. SM2513 TaxID=3424766 RepID=UPI003D7FA900